MCHTRTHTAIPNPLGVGATGSPQSANHPSVPVDPISKFRFRRHYGSQVARDDGEPRVQKPDPKAAHYQ